MPTYDYLCEKCQDKRTVTLSLKESEVIQVCKCGQVMRRDYGFAATQFKGSGFYTTDKNNG